MRPLGIDLEHYFLMKKERINLGSLAMLSKKKQPCISNGALSLKQLKGLQGNRGSLKRDVNGAGDPKSEKDKDLIHVIVNFSKKKKWPWG